MTNEELAIEIQNGKTEYYPVLWDQVERFIKKKANERMRKLPEGVDVEFDELYDSGFFAVVNAVKYYKPEKGCTFLTILGYSLKTAFSEVTGIRTAKGRNDPLRYALSFDAPVANDKETMTLADVIADDTDFVEESTQRANRKAMRKALDAALDKLPPKEAEAIRLQYYSGHSVEQTAEAMGLDQTQVTSLRHSAMSRLRTPEMLEELEQYAYIPTTNKRRQRLSNIKEKETAINSHFDALKARCGLCI